MKKEFESRDLPSLSLLPIMVLALLSAVAPLATDMYLPGFPAMARDLGASAAEVQMSLTSFLVALAVGQLLIGPLSDRFGRRRPLIMGTLSAIVAGGLCAVVNDVHGLIVLRALQGLGGAAGLVLARAIISDSTPDEVVAARLFQLMMIIGGLAPVLAPVVGTGITLIAGWKVIFVVISLLSLISLIGVLFCVRETLPEPQRSAGGVGELRQTLRSLLSNRRFVGYALTQALAFMVLFGYIAASPFVYQSILGFSAASYSIVFGANACAMMLGGVLSAWLLGRTGPRRLTFIGLLMLLSSTAFVFTGVMAGAGANILVPAIFLSVAPIGMILGNASALAIAEAPRSAGTASAVLGALQFTLGGIASPLVGLAGEESAVPMAIVMLLAASLALLSFLLSSTERSAQQMGMHLSS